MKIVMISGSPRKGDGYKVYQQIQSILKGKDDPVDLKFLQLSRLVIEECRGCGLCFQKGEQACPLNDDTRQVRETMERADALIFSAPVYACSIPGGMKKLIDRLSYLFHRPGLAGKPALLLVTTDGGGVKPTMHMLNMTAAGWGCSVIDSISIVSSFYFENRPFNNYYSPSYASSKKKELERKINRFYTFAADGKMKKPGFYDMYLFNGLKGKAWFSPADYRHWKERGWLEADYYYPVKLGVMKLLFARVMSTLVGMMRKKMEKSHEWSKSQGEASEPSGSRIA